jgi:biopolymer transport protein ExbD
MINLDDEKKSQEYESILPLINIVFLLLIFFILAGAFTTADVFEVSPPKSDNKDKVDPKEHLILIDDDNTLAYQGHELSIEELKINVSNELQTNDKTKLIFKIKADANVDATDVIVLVDLLQDLGASNIELLTVNE